MGMVETIAQWLIGLIIIFSSIGVVASRKPIHSSLYFLLTLLMLAAFYLQLAAPFIAVIQIIIYAGAILVIFVFVIILFQDAHEKIDQVKAKSFFPLLVAAASTFFATFIGLGFYLSDWKASNKILSDAHGAVETLGQALYINYFFPFEAVILLFLIAIIGSIYIARKET